MWKQNFFPNTGHFKGLQPRNAGAIPDFSHGLRELSHVGLWSHILRAQALLFPFSPPSLSLIQCMKLRFESWRGSLWEGGGTCYGSRAPPRGRAPPSQPFGTMNKERKYTILSKRDGECPFLRPKRKVKALGHFLAPLSAGLGGEAAISEAFALGRSATKVDKSCKAWLLLVL